MQKQVHQALTTTQDPQAAGPVEIDAQMLQFIGGGAPKTTWGQEPSAAAATADNEDPAPKTTW